MRKSIEDLVSGENVVYHTYIHGAVFLSGIFWLILGFAIAPSPFPLRFIMIFPLLAAFGLLLRGGIEYFFTEIVLTPHYFIFKSGLLFSAHLKTFWMNIDKVTVTCSLLGRSLNYGTITLVNLTGLPLAIHYVSNPQKLQEYMLRLIQEQKTLYESYIKTENIKP